MHITVDKLYTGLKKCDPGKELAIMDADENQFCMVAYDTDDQDNLCLYFEECGEGSGYTIEDILDLLKDYRKDAGVYIACYGIYLDIVADPEGDPELVEDDDDFIECAVSQFGTYDDTKSRQPMKYTKKRKKGFYLGVTVMVILVLLSLICLGYYGLALVNGEGQMWENILFILGALLVGGVNLLTLRYLKD